MKPRVASALVLVALAATGTVSGGCDSLKHDVVFLDSEGRTFVARCGRRCDTTDPITTEAGEPKPSSPIALPDHRPGWVLSAANARYMTVCAGWQSGEGTNTSNMWSSGDCRLVACGRESKCPSTIFMESPTCIDGFCGDPSRKLESQDVEALCVAGTGPEGPATPEQTRRRDAASMACMTGTCSVPSACLKP